MNKNLIYLIPFALVLSIVLVIVDPAKRSWYVQKIKEIKKIIKIKKVEE